MKCPIVNKEACVGCGSCVAMCPKVYIMDDDGKSKVVDCKGASENEIQQTIDVCPVQAIKWEEK
ncbi:ferredoxin [Candidatus Micrarchaeota archaeon]|jgi:ferredoxin|nr:ferredoxin [Candidatus Micrarchaeota archaeon]